MRTSHTQSSVFPNILLDDIKPLPASSLEMAEALWRASVLAAEPRKKLQKWEAIESAITNVFFSTKIEAEIALDCHSAIRQRLAERTASPAVMGATYARSLQLLSGHDSTDRTAVIGWHGGVADVGWVRRTMLIASTVDMEAEGLFFALRNHLGWSFPHREMPALTDTGDIIQRPAYLEHIPLLPCRFPSKATSSQMCRAIFLSLQKVLGNKDFAEEERRMRTQGHELYIRGRLMGHQVSLLAITGFTSAHIQFELPQVWRLLLQLANDGIVLVMHGSPAIQLQTARREFAELFPQAPLEVVGYDPENFANIAKATWDLMDIPGPMPEALLEILDQVHARRGLARQVWLLINRLVNRQGVRLEKATKDVQALVDEACAGHHAVVLKQLDALADLDEGRCMELIDDLPYEVSLNILVGIPALGAATTDADPSEVS